MPRLILAKSCLARVLALPAASVYSFIHPKRGSRLLPRWMTCCEIATRVKRGFRGMVSVLLTVADISENRSLPRFSLAVRPLEHRAG